MAILTTSGLPSDSTGSTGDYAIDPAAHFIYGPKTTTWSGTASSLQGPSGPGMVYGNGAPTSGQGAIGQGYLDLSTGNFYGPKASNGAWGNAVSKIQGAAGVSVLTGSGTPTGTGASGVSGQTYIDINAYNLYVFSNGAWSLITSMIGPAGPTYLSGVGAGIGPYGVFGTATLTSTPQNFTFPGTTTIATFTPIAPSAFLGVYAYASATATVYLYDATAGTTVYSGAIPSGGGNLVTSYFTATQYPLIAGHTYQWQITGSASAYAQVEPFYLMPSNSPGLCVNTIQAAGFSTAQTFSSTAVNLPVFGASSTFLMVHVPVRTGGVYSAVGTYYPSGSTTSSSYVNLSLKYGPAISGVSGSGTVGFTMNTLYATGQPTTLLTPQLTDLTSLARGYYFYWSATGTGTGTLVVTLYALV